jgi:hypothetical protein
MNSYRVRFKLLKKETIYNSTEDKTVERFIFSDLVDYWLQAIDNIAIYDEIDKCVKVFNETSQEAELEFFKILDTVYRKSLPELEESYLYDE